MNRRSQLTEDAVIVGKGFTHETVVYPRELLDGILKLSAGMYSLEEALWFYSVVKDAKSYRWVTAEELVGISTLGDIEFWHYEANYEDSAWSCIREVKDFVLVEGEPGYSTDYVSWVEIDGEEGYYSLDLSESILIVEREPEEPVFALPVS